MLAQEKELVQEEAAYDTQALKKRKRVKTPTKKQEPITLGYTSEYFDDVTKMHSRSSRRAKELKK